MSLFVSWDLCLVLSLLCFNKHLCYAKKKYCGLSLYRRTHLTRLDIHSWNVPKLQTCNKCIQSAPRTLCEYLKTLCWQVSISVSSSKVLKVLKGEEIGIISNIRFFSPLLYYYSCCSLCVNCLTPIIQANILSLSSVYFLFLVQFITLLQFTPSHKGGSKNKKKEEWMMNDSILHFAISLLIVKKEKVECQVSYI